MNVLAEDQMLCAALLYKKDISEDCWFDKPMIQYIQFTDTQHFFLKDVCYTETLYESIYIFPQ